MDDKYQYRTVALDWKTSAAKVTKRNILQGRCPGDSWRWLGIQMSYGWRHIGWSPCELDSKNNYLMIFRRPLGMDGQHRAEDKVFAERLRKAQKEGCLSLEELSAKSSRSRPS